LNTYLPLARLGELGINEPGGGQHRRAAAADQTHKTNHASRDAIRFGTASRKARFTDRRETRSVGRCVDFRVDSRLDCRVDSRVDCRVDWRVDLCVGCRLDWRVGSRLDRRVDLCVGCRLDRRVDLCVGCRLDRRIRACIRAGRAANSTTRAANSTTRAANSTTRAANSTTRAANSTTCPTCRSCGSARTHVCGYFIVAAARRDRTGDEDERQTSKDLRHALHIHAPIDWTWMSEVPYMPLSR
jgi:hypothetical protein